MSKYFLFSASNLIIINKIYIYNLPLKNIQLEHKHISQTKHVCLLRLLVYHQPPSQGHTSTVRWR